jgi:DNA-binding transcriptional MerR regulator
MLARSATTGLGNTGDCMGPKGLKVGDVAKRTGITVRTLHHYDEIGLLRPSLRTDSGHRLYVPEDLARLQYIVSLRQLGFSLEETKACLDRGDFSAVQTLRTHAARLRLAIREQQSLCDRLEGLARLLAAAEEVSADRFLEIIEEMTRMENYYTPEQLAQLKQRADRLGAEGMKAAQDEWPRLMDAMKAEMEAGTAPSEPRVQKLARRWKELVDSFTGGDPGIAASLQKLWQEQGANLAAQHGMSFDPRLMEYSAKAQASLAQD